MAKNLPDGVRFADGEYAVTTTLYLRDAKTADEAVEQAMQWRNAVRMFGLSAEGPFARERAELVRGITFDWHLHDPWGC